MFSLRLQHISNKIRIMKCVKGATMPEVPDPRAYLDTEARIIAENETHAVIALRVEKSSIARNLPLLAALADLVPTPKILLAAKSK